MDSEKSINLFEIGHLIIYETMILFGNSFITFRHYYYAKYVFDIFKIIVFRFSLYREVVKF